MSEEYDLKKSENKIGQLYPILITKDGKIIDGFHRKSADPNWKTLVLPEIDDEEKLLAARLIANFHRRQVSKEEKEEWINGLAKIYRKQGLSPSTPNRSGQIYNEIKEKLVEVTGLNPDTILGYLSDEFKQEAPRGRSIHTVPTSEKVEKLLGKKGVEKYKKQVLAEANLSPQEKAALTKKRQHDKEERAHKREENKRIKEEKRKEHEEQIRKQAEESAKEKLLQDKQFIKDAAKLAPSIKDEENKKDLGLTIPTVEEYDENQTVERFLTDYKKALKTMPKEVRRDDVKTAIRFFKQLLEAKHIVCPACGEDHLQWRCGHEF